MPALLELPREFGSEGHRLLCASAYSPSEIARLAGVPRPRVSEWRKGVCSPSSTTRQALERTVGIPARAWDAAAVPQPKPPQPEVPLRPAPPPAAVPVAIPATFEAAVVATSDPKSLFSLGLAGLERLAKRFRDIEPTLPSRERVVAIQSEARILAVHEQLRQKQADARSEFLGSPEFLADVRTLLAAVPGPALELRSRLERLGVPLPAPPEAAKVAEDPPTTSDDIDEIVRELETAERFRQVGEPALAMAHTLGLGLDQHAGAIAEILVGDEARRDRLVGLLDGADARVMRQALERATAMRGVALLDEASRTVVATLLELLGHEALAKRLRP